MGQFSWLDCKTGEQVIDNHPRDVYLLVPRQLGGGHIKETCYDGYGHFGGKDVYDLVAAWNRDFIPVVLNNLGDVWRCSMSAGQAGAGEQRWLTLSSAKSCHHQKSPVLRVRSHRRWLGGPS